ncbi:MAG: hypothetical protein ACRBK7_08700 [Acidimicrobiales bacterium]
MAVVVVPTLEAMAEIYSLSSSGADQSPRFTTYIEACRSGQLLHGFNPMTTKPVAPVIESMLEFNAEQVVLEAGLETSELLSADEDIALFLSVAAPGMWTDRRANSIEHQLAPRHHGELLLWFDDDQSPASVRAAAIEQTVRAIWWARSEDSPPTLSAVVCREGLAGALAGRQGEHSGAAAEVEEILGEDRSHATAVAFLFGDNAAQQLGYPTLGLSHDEGLGHAIARTQQECAEVDIRQAAQRLLTTCLT